MKSLFSVVLLALTLTLGASAAHAENCTSLLKNNAGYTLDTFNAYGYNRSQACTQSQIDCQRAMRNGRHTGPGMRCEIAQNGGYGQGNGGYGQGNGGYGQGNGGYGQGNGGYGQGNGGYGQGNGGYGQSCVATLEGNYGQRIQTFYAQASGGYGQENRDACRNALRECNRYKTEYGYYNARCSTNY